MDKVSQKWLKAAKDDLIWTKANLREKIYYGACFTSQQAAEKALKAFLLSKEKSLRKIHDLGAILEECILIDKAFKKLRKACINLTDYYLQPRYPDMSEFMIYSEKDAYEAFKFATQIVEFVEKKLTF